ncbi:MAG: hypothetical protein K2Y40_12640 [Reyranella sp.]|nr:hypothetical protein [Reyranella sp.]
MSCHPLIAAMIEVDTKASLLMRSTGNSRQREGLRDAIADLRLTVLDVVGAQAAAGIGPIDLDTFKAIVRRGHDLGLAWPDMVAAFTAVQEGER